MSTRLDDFRMSAESEGFLKHGRNDRQPCSTKQRRNSVTVSLAEATNRNDIVLEHFCKRQHSLNGWRT